MPGNVHNINNEPTLDAIGGLLTSLVPRASLFLVYDAEQRLLWSSDRSDDDEVDALVVDFASQGDGPASERRTLGSGRTALAVAAIARNGERLGTLVALFSRNAGKSSWFDAKSIARMLAPAAHTVAELLRLERRAGAMQSSRAGIQEELKLVYLVDKKLHGPGRRHSGLAEIVGQGGRFLKIGYSVLLVPSKRIRVSATHSSWKSVNRRALDRYIVERLIPKLDGSGPWCGK